MFRYLFTNQRTWPTRLLLTVALAACLVWFGVSFLRGRVLDDAGVVGATGTSAKHGSGGREDALPKLQGAQAQQYLERTGDGQSLMQAVTAARFGLKWQERSPFDGEVRPKSDKLKFVEQQERAPFGRDTSGGYLGMSHDQNLNAWFDEAGVTVRPTVPEKERAHAWQLGFSLKSYGYGERLVTAPPIVAHKVKENRIEYERSHCQLPIANCRFENTGFGESAFDSPQSSFETFSKTQSVTDDQPVFQSAIGNRQSAITEWYENRAQGIEQGFTVNSRPAHAGDVAANEPLRLVVSLSGDLRACTEDAGQKIELVDKKGEGALSYSKLTAVDADGKPLAARMEASADGREIALVVGDDGARYPIVIDPIVATLEKRLEAGNLQGNAAFGNAVAIDGDMAVVGAALEDSGVAVDIGTVYFFSRTGSTWTLGSYAAYTAAGYQCGYSVGISNGRVVVGCPGANSNTGKVFMYSPSAFRELIPPPDTYVPRTGDRYGASVAIKGTNTVVVGAPFHDFGDASNSDYGIAFVFDLDFNLNILKSSRLKYGPYSGITGAQFGACVAMDGENFDTIVVGMPGANFAAVYKNSSGNWIPYNVALYPNDGNGAQLFGQSVAVSVNTIVVGAPTDDEKGTRAGAAYVFVRDASGNWSQQQKLTASDARANDLFGYGIHAVAIQGNTIVVGALYQDGGSSNPNDNRGAAYIFTRNGTLWTQETKLSAPAFVGAPGDLFGVSVDISFDTVIVGAQRAAANDGTANTGAAYVYRLDCVPPYIYYQAGNENVCPVGSETLVFGFVDGKPDTRFQWRKNGVNIQGATSGSYTINNVSAGDAGSYDVIISNSCGSEISNAVTLTVHTFSLSPTSGNFGASGSPGSVSVRSTGSCYWTATSNATWIRIDSGSPGTGPGPSTVGFTVAANPNPGQRTGTITIGDKTFTVTQDGLNCSYAIAPTSQNFTASGGANSVNVTATAGCAWTAASNDSWITVPPGAGGTGSGTLNYTVAANTGPSRTGTLTVAGQTFTVTQASGCTYSIAPATQNFPASVAAGAVNVTTAAGCAWTAASNSSFITITSGTSGTGNGTVNYSVTANSGTSSRSGTMTIGGQTFTVTQDGSAPLVSNLQFSATNYNKSEGGPSTNITVTRTGDSSGTAAVDFRTGNNGYVACNVVSGSAAQNCDFIISSGTLNFAPGQTSRSFPIIIIDDLYVEGSETLSLTLSNPSGAVLGTNTATLTITDNDSATPTTNPPDDAAYFGRQHYYDFLGRLPDDGGLAYWTNEITQCGTNTTCINTKRVDVSNAFFYEQEYQQTASYVFLLYRASFGNDQPFPNPDFFDANLSASLRVEAKKLPRYLSFARDRVQVLGGSDLPQTQLALANAFVQRPEFVTKYPLSLAIGAQFVDAVLATIRNDSGAELVSQRDTLIGHFNVGGRGLVMFHLANDYWNGCNRLPGNPPAPCVPVTYGAAVDNRAFIDAEYNRSFVCSQYTGYLRRDGDINGFLFWLNQVSAAPPRNVAKQHAMVCSFITSAEYQSRFSSVVTHTNGECFP